MLRVLSVFVIVNVLFVAFLAAICLPGCAMYPSTQPTELEFLRHRVAALESENECLRKEFATFGTKFETAVREREAMRTQLQKYKKLVTSLTQARNDALAVLREGIPAVSDDTPPPAASDCLSEPSPPNKCSRSAMGPDGAE